jgi:hypothetical protein
MLARRIGKYPPPLQAFTNRLDEATKDFAVGGRDDVTGSLGHWRVRRRRRKESARHWTSFIWVRREERQEYGFPSDTFRTIYALASRIFD